MFCKYEDSVLYTANDSVHTPDNHLIAEDYLSYTYPVEGWYWFDSEALAKEFFQIEDQVTEDEDSNISGRGRLNR